MPGLDPGIHVFAVCWNEAVNSRLGHRPRRMGPGFAGMTDKGEAGKHLPHAAFPWHDRREN